VLRLHPLASRASAGRPVSLDEKITENAMGGTGDRLDACAREMYAEWAACHHFHLYDDVEAVLRELVARQLKIGLISNSHRSMDEFVEHFAATREWEWRQWLDGVTDWEMKRYFEII